jgi:hypothetical protein
MEPNQPDVKVGLKEKLLRLLRKTALGSMVAASTILSAGSADAATTPVQEKPSLEQRVEAVRKQQDAVTRGDAAVESARDLLAWWNWHNWRNGWPNGWHNWHNWHNWW